MTKYYYCARCKTFHEESACDIHYEYEDGYRTGVYWYTCPIHPNEEVIEADICPICGEPFISDIGKDICDDCIARVHDRVDKLVREIEVEEYNSYKKYDDFLYYLCEEIGEAANNLYYDWRHRNERL